LGDARWTRARGVKVSKVRVLQFVNCSIHPFRNRHMEGRGTQPQTDFRTSNRHHTGRHQGAAPLGKPTRESNRILQPMRSPLMGVGILSRDEPFREVLCPDGDVNNTANRQQQREIEDRRMLELGLDPAMDERDAYDVDASQFQREEDFGPEDEGV